MTIATKHDVVVSPKLYLGFKHADDSDNTGDDLNDQVSHLVISNPPSSNDFYAYKFTTNRKNGYITRPSIGILSPGDVQHVTLVLTDMARNAILAEAQAVEQQASLSQQQQQSSLSHHQSNRNNNASSKQKTNVIERTDKLRIETRKISLALASVFSKQKNSAIGMLLSEEERTLALKNVWEDLIREDEGSEVKVEKRLMHIVHKVYYCKVDDVVVPASSSPSSPPPPHSSSSSQCSSSLPPQTQSESQQRRFSSTSYRRRPSEDSFHSYNSFEDDDQNYLLNDAVDDIVIAKEHNHQHQNQPKQQAVSSLPTATTIVPPLPPSPTTTAVASATNASRRQSQSSNKNSNSNNKKELIRTASIVGTRRTCYISDDDPDTDLMKDFSDLRDCDYDYCDDDDSDTNYVESIDKSSRSSKSEPSGGYGDVERSTSRRGSDELSTPPKRFSLKQLFIKNDNGYEIEKRLKNGKNGKGNGDISICTAVTNDTWSCSGESAWSGRSGGSGVSGWSRGGDGGNFHRSTTIVPVKFPACGRDYSQDQDNTNSHSNIKNSSANINICNANNIHCKPRSRRSKSSDAIRTLTRSLKISDRKPTLATLEIKGQHTTNINNNDNDNSRGRSQKSSRKSRRDRSKSIVRRSKSSDAIAVIPIAINSVTSLSKIYSEQEGEEDTIKNESSRGRSQKNSRSFGRRDRSESIVTRRSKSSDAISSSSKNHSKYDSSLHNEDITTTTTSFATTPRRRNVSQGNNVSVSALGINGDTDTTVKANSITGRRSIKSSFRRISSSSNKERSKSSHAKASSSSMATQAATSSTVIDDNDPFEDDFLKLILGGERGAGEIVSMLMGDEIEGDVDPEFQRQMQAPYVPRGRMRGKSVDRWV